MPRTTADPALDAWSVDAATFPEHAPVEDQLAFLIRYAILAPSGHNTQPWHFRIDGPEVEILADRSRGLPVVDPDDRALVIACGAALGTLEVAAGHFGFRLSVDDLPGDREEDVLVRVRVTGRDPVIEGDDPEFAAITTRRTNRARFDDRPLPDEVAARLVDLARGGRCWLHLASDPAERERLAELVSSGDRIQMADSSFRRELAAWVRQNHSARPDGIRGYGFGFGDLMSRAGPFVIRTFDMGSGQAAKDWELAAGAPVLAVLGTDGDTPLDWICAGRALSRVLLAARAADLWAGFLNQPIEVPSLRHRVPPAVGRTGTPQLLFRLGYGPTPEPEPRRPIDEVLLRS